MALKIELENTLYSSSFLKDLVKSWCYFSLKCLVELIHEAILAYALFGGRFQITDLIA